MSITGFPEVWQNQIQDASVFFGNLQAYLLRSRWFGGKSRQIQSIDLHRVEIVFHTCGAAIWQVNYSDGAFEWYSLALTHQRVEGLPEDAIVSQEKGFGWVDALYTSAFSAWCWNCMVSGGGKHLSGENRLLKEKEFEQARVLKTEQSNSALIFNEQFFFKWFRKVDASVNPDLEIIRFLSEETDFRNIPVYRGKVEWMQPGGSTLLLAMMQDLVPNVGDAWVEFGREVHHYFEEVQLAGFSDGPTPAFEHIPEQLNALIGIPLFRKVTGLATRTAQMHLALASNTRLPDFAPEPFDHGFQLWMYGCLEELCQSKFALLENTLDALSAQDRRLAEIVLQNKNRILGFFHVRLQKPIQALRIRVHGDYHLGQVLSTGEDFVVLDFEGEPDKPHSMRRLKYGALKDVAGMIRSFHYAAYAALRQHHDDPALMLRLQPWAEQWYQYVNRLFLDTYLEVTKGSGLVPPKKQWVPLLQLYLFEKAIYELGYELNNRPQWAGIPLISLEQFVRHYLSEEKKT
jgi:maltose alpha-D-glucosyltransferase/alpha-amylase